MKHGEEQTEGGEPQAGDCHADVVAELAMSKERRVLVGECKWWKAPAGRNVLDDLKVRLP
jgi:hypothetical protein